MTYLVDTNVISELSRPYPYASVLRWAEQVQCHSLSVISVEEIWYGISKRPSVRLRTWMDGYLQRHSILAVIESIASRAGELRGALAQRGWVRTQADMLIAATAQLHGLILVTRNIKDFENCGIGLLNPFDSVLTPQG